MPAAITLGRSTVKSRLDDFSHHWRERIDRWRADGHGHTEKSAAQQFWSDLFRCFGVIPETVDLPDLAATCLGVTPLDVVIIEN